MKRSLLILCFLVFPLLAHGNPSSEVKKDFLKGFNAAQKGEDQKAIQFFKKIKKADLASQDYVLFFLARSQRALKQCQRSKENFRELVQKYRTSRWAPLARVQATSDKPCPPLVEPIHVERVVSCDDIKSFKEKIECLFDLRRYKEVRNLLYVHLQAQGGRGQLPLYVKLSQSAARIQDYATSLWANETVRKKFPKTKEARESLEKIAYLHQVSQHHDRAIPVLKRLIKEARSKKKRRIHWQDLGWSYFRVENFERSVQAFKKGNKIRASSFSLYWMGKGLEELGRKKEAKKAYRRLTKLYPRYYYSLRVLKKLPRRYRKKLIKKWWKNPPHTIAWKKERVFMAASKDLERIHELKFFGLREEARIEMRRARTSWGIMLPENPKKLKKEKDGFTFNSYSLKNEQPEYPLPFSHFLFRMVSKHAHQLDPLFFYAMMRQESHFRESAVSNAGAMGILQIMPATGHRLAREADWSDFHQRWLFDPLTNIELAIYYVKKLNKEFGNKWYVVAASYNAGEGVVRSWLKARPKLKEEIFIEEIPYEETRHYVKQVYSNYAAYQWIYR